MAENPRQAFIEATFRLSRSAAWTEFEQTFRQYVASKVEEAMKAPTSEVLIAHGAARAMLSLRDDFIGIDAAFQKFHKP